MVQLGEGAADTRRVARLSEIVARRETSGKPLTGPLEHQDGVLRAAFSSDGTRVVTISGYTAWVWEAATGKPLTVLLHKGRVRSAAFSSDGTWVVTASDDHTARVWNAASGEPVTGPLAHHGGVVSAAFSSDQATP